MNVCIDCGKEYASTDLSECPSCGGRLVLLRTDGETLAGRKLAGRYLLLEQLGEGGMGSVYRAKHLHLDKMVAIKVLRLTLTKRRETIQRFYAEARNSSKLKHPHNINVTDFGHTEDGLAYLAMDLVEGTLLSEIHKPMPPERALKIISQVCNALDEAHGIGLVHRDLKPDNIMISQVDRADFARILDYGIAKLKDSSHGLTEEGVLIGTPEYMAPEQITGLDLDGRCDIYTLGLILYEMITGRPPFRGPDSVSVLYQHRYERPPLPSEFAPIPKGVESLIMHCLAKDREARPSSAIELRKLIETLLARGLDQEVERRLPPTLTSLKRQQGDHRQQNPPLADEEGIPSVGQKYGQSGPTQPFAEPHARRWSSSTMTAAVSIAVALVAVVSFFIAKNLSGVPSNDDESNPVVHTSADPSEDHTGQRDIAIAVPELPLESTTEPPTPATEIVAIPGTAAIGAPPAAEVIPVMNSWADSLVDTAGMTTDWLVEDPPVRTIAPDPASIEVMASTTVQAGAPQTTSAVDENTRTTAQEETRRSGTRRRHRHTSRENIREEGTGQENTAASSQPHLPTSPATESYQSSTVREQRQLLREQTQQLLVPEVSSTE